ncbi:MAG TPA: hypothetical protein VK508_09085 [Cyclobacteriaceae bacterium]|nr:hypothetical protein [Cyclobacteriaceae bacterium]
MGEFGRIPQIATLNALANYFDYKTWQDYKASKIKNAPEKEPANESADKVRPKFRGIYQAIAGVILFLTGIYFFGATNETV